MTYNAIKQLEKKIRKTKARIAAIDAQAVSTSQQLSHQPRSSASTGGKVENLVLEKVSLEERLADLELEHEAAVSSIDTISDEYIRSIISLKVKKHYSWKRIASLVTGSAAHYDTVSKACRRYKW